MKTINLYPPHIDTAPIIDGEKWPLNETREVFKILDSGKQKLVGVVGNGCTMCSRAKKRETDAIVKPRLMRGKHPEQGRVLCVFSYLSFGVTVDHMVDLIRRVGFEGDLLIDIPIRCGTGATTESQMTRCSPYLRMSYHQFKPDRILCFGANASKSVLGISVPAWVNRWCWTAIPEEVATEDQYVSNRRIPVVSLMDPIAYNRSRVHREIIDSEVEWALKADFPDHRPVGMAYIVEGVEDLPAVERWVERVRQTTGWIAYDVETNGVMHNPDFSIIMCSVAATSIPHVLLWDKQALDNPALMERLVQLLTDPTIRKRGQNEKYDALSWLTWKGVTVAPVDGDCRLEMKLANADSKADLESLGFYVGVNAHKTEAKEWMQQAILSAKEDLDPDIEGVNAKAYAYKYLPSEVLSRYNALDTKVTAAVCQHARGLLGPLEKTLHRLVLPASELFKRIEYKGMAVDVNGIEAARQYLETEIASLAPRFEREGLDPDKPDTIRVWLENMGIDSPIKTDKGLASTNAKALKLVESKNELIAAILRHRKLAKLLSSYADTLPGYIRADGRVHPSFLLDGARSGRLSCIAGECRMLTNHGWVRFDELESLLTSKTVYTITHEGRWRRVTACWSNGVRPTVFVRSKDGKQIRVTSDHRLHTSESWVQAGDTRGSNAQVLRLERLESLEGEISTVRGLDADLAQRQFNGMGSEQSAAPSAKAVAMDVLLCEDEVARRSGKSWCDKKAVLQHDKSLPIGLRSSHRDEKGQGHSRKKYREQERCWTEGGHSRSRDSRDGKVGPYCLAAAQDDGAQRVSYQVKSSCTGSGSKFRSTLHEDQVSIPRGLRGFRKVFAWNSPLVCRREDKPRSFLRCSVQGLAQHELLELSLQEAHACNAGAVQERLPSSPGVYTFRRRKLSCKTSSSKKHTACKTSKDYTSGLTSDSRLYYSQQSSCGSGRRYAQVEEPSGIGCTADSAVRERGLQSSSRERTGCEKQSRQSYRSGVSLTGYERVIDVEEAGECEVFDFTVEDDHSACIEGFFAHNCTSPALQTIPSRGEMAKLIKNCFVATKGYKLVCLDFAILEIRIAAVLSGDPDMAVAAQGDFHTETAKALAQLAWNTTPEAVEAEIKSGNKSKRDTAKTLGFAILYGAGPHSIAESVGCSVPAAERLITGFLTKYKKLKAWMRDQVQFARDNACVDIPWLDGTIGRRRPLLNIHSADNGERGNAERGAVNSPIQSLASDICLSSAVKIDEWYRANSIPASIVCLVHDSIISEVREDFVDEVTRTKAHLMTSWPTGPVPLKVEAEVGYAWGSLQKVSV